MHCMWIYIWAVHESLSKYGTFTYFPGCHTELGNNLLLADAFLKYCNMVLENTPHRPDSKKFRKVNSAATWVCFIKFKQLTIMRYFIIHCEPEGCLPTEAMLPNPAIDKTAQLSKHMAQQGDELTEQLSTSKVTCPTFSLPRPWLQSPVPLPLPP